MSSNKKECVEKVVADVVIRSQLTDFEREEETNSVVFLSSLLPRRALSSRNINEKLLTVVVQNDDDSTDNANTNLISLLEGCIFQVKNKSNYGKNEKAQPVRSLIASPSAYDTSWIVSCNFIQSVNNRIINDDSLSLHDIDDVKLRIYAIVDEIQNFFQTIVTYWWEEERKQQRQNHDDDTRFNSNIKMTPVRKAGLGENLTNKSSKDWMIQFLLRIMKLISSPYSTSTTSSRSDDDDVSALYIHDDKEMEYDKNTPVSGNASASFVTKTKSNEKNQIIEEIKSKVLELVSTILFISSQFDKSLLKVCLKHVFEKSDIGEDDWNILHWMKLALASKNLLREKDWECIHDKVLSWINSGSLKIDENNVKNFVEVIFSICFVKPNIPTLSRTSPSEGTTNDGCMIFQWQPLLLKLMTLISNDTGMYCDAEVALHLRLSNLPLSSIRQWIIDLETMFDPTPTVYHQSLKTEEDTSLAVQSRIPLWIGVNMLLLVNRSIRRFGSQFASILLQEALTGRGAFPNDANDLISCSWTLLGKLLRQTGNESCGQARRPTTKKRPTFNMCDADAIRNAFDDVSYTGNGTFTSSSCDTNLCHLVSGVGSVLYQCMFLNEIVGGDPAPSSLDVTKERANSLRLYCNNVIHEEEIHDDAVIVIQAIVSLVFLYLEVPSLRAQIAQEIKEKLRFNNQMGQRKIIATACYSSAIPVLLRSIERLKWEGLTSTELDQLSEIFVSPMPLDIFARLAQSLSPLEEVRRVLSRIAHEQLSLPLAAKRWIKNEAEHFGSNVSSVDAIKIGLLASLVVISYPKWGECEAQAWVKLSAFIVDGCTHVPLLVRSWFFGETSKYVEGKLFTDAIVQHLLRTCLARIVGFCAQDANGCDRFAFEMALERFDTGDNTANADWRQSEDISGLFDLTFSLIRFATLKCPKRKSLFHSCREILKELVPTTKDHHRSDDGSADVLVHLCRETSHDNLTYMSAFQYFSLALAENNFLESADWAMAPAAKVKSSLAAHEVKEIKRHSSQVDLPNWLKAPAASFSRRSPPSKGFVRRIQLDLVDLLLEILVARNVPSPCPAGKVVPLGSGSRSAKISSMLAKTREFIDVDDESYERQHCIDWGARKRVILFDALLEVFVPDIKLGITGNRGFHQVKGMIAACLDLCETVRTRLQFQGCSGSIQLQSLWGLYKCLCSEDAVLVFISYLESNCNFAEKEILFDISIQSPHDVDSVVRLIRLSILQCFSAILSSAGCGDIPSSQLLFESDGCEDRPLELVLTMVGTLCVDLRRGLEGNSGGLTYDIFWGFVTCIEGCTEILKRIAEHCLDERQMRAVLDTCKEVEELFNDVLRSFDINEPNLLRKTIFLCTDRLPFIRKTICFRLCSIGRSDVVKKNSRWAQFGFQMFEEVAEILRRRVETEKASSATWEEFVDPEHLSDAEAEHDDDKRVNVFGRKRGSKRRRQNSILTKKLRISRESAWTISFCSLLAAFETLWNDSVNSFAVSHSEHAASCWFSVRTEELLRTLSCIGLVFRATGSNSSKAATCDSGMINKVSVHARGLPTEAKHSLLCLVDHILFVLCKAVTALFAHLADSQKHSTLEYCHPTVQENMRFLSAWMTLANDDADFTYGLQKWLEAEKLVELQACQHQRRLLRRIPRVHARLEELEQMMRKLWQSLKRLSVCPAHSHIATLHFLNRLVAKPGQKEAKAGSVFCRVIANKLAFVRGKRREVAAFVDSLAGGSRIREQKKRQCSPGEEFLTPRTSRQRTVRSRNGVVNRWLQLDREKVGRSSDLGDNIDNDAYADLEDFIVDG